MDTNRPKLAIVVTVIAGALVVLDGIVLWLEGAFLNVIQPGLWTFTIFLGETELLEGFGLIGLALVTVVWPRSHVYTGVAIIGVSLVSLIGGGGFFIGTPIGIVGGILSIIFRIQYFAEPREYLPSRALSADASAVPPSAGATQEPGAVDQLPREREPSP